jgi:hypothetical protein
MLIVGVDVGVNAATVVVEVHQGSVALAIRVLVASVVASLGSTDALMLTMGADVRVSVAIVAAAEEAASSLDFLNLILRLATLFSPYFK